MSDAERDSELARLRASLYGPGAAPDAAERYRAALARTASATEAGEPDGGGTTPTAVQPGRPPAVEPAAPRPGRRLPAALAAGAALVAAVGAALLLAPHPAAEPAVPTLRVGPAIWSGHGTSAASSPELDGHGGPVLVRLTCRGSGGILLALDGRVRSLTCLPGKRIEDDQYFDGAHDGFLLSMSLVGHPEWRASVHRVRLGAGG